MALREYKLKVTFKTGRRKINDDMSVDVMETFNLTFLGQVSKKFTCALCQELLRDPCLVTCCNVAYCRGCITSLNETSGKCANNRCRKNYSIINGGVEELNRKIDHLKVQCLYKSEGCSWSGTLLEFGTRHLKWTKYEAEDSSACSFQEVRCPNSGCGVMVPRGSVQNHLDRECTEEIRDCEYCGAEDTANEIYSNHLSVIECPNKCSMPPQARCHIRTHIEEECPLREVLCEFRHAGCDKSIKFADIAKHNREFSDRHLHLLSEKLQYMANENLSLREENEKLQRHVHDLQMKIRASSTLKEESSHSILMPDTYVAMQNSRRGEVECEESESSGSLDVVMEELELESSGESDVVATRESNVKSDVKIEEIEEEYDNFNNLLSKTPPIYEQLDGDSKPTEPTLTKSLSNLPSAASSSSILSGSGLKSILKKSWRKSINFPGGNKESKEEDKKGKEETTDSVVKKNERYAIFTKHRSVSLPVEPKEVQESPGTYSNIKQGTIRKLSADIVSVSDKDRGKLDPDKDLQSSQQHSSNAYQNVVRRQRGTLQDRNNFQDTGKLQDTAILQDANELQNAAKLGNTAANHQDTIKLEQRSKNTPHSVAPTTTTMRYSMTELQSLKVNPRLVEAVKPRSSFSQLSQQLPNPFERPPVPPRNSMAREDSKPPLPPKPLLPPKPQHKHSSPLHHKNLPGNIGIKKIIQELESKINNPQQQSS